MGKELPILPASAQPAQTAAAERALYSRVFCQKENSPPLRLLIDFLKSRGQLPILPPDMDQTLLDEWAWTAVSIGYARDRKPIQVFCVRDRGTYKDVYDQEREEFLRTLGAFDDIEAQLVSVLLTEG